MKVAEDGATEVATTATSAACSVCGTGLAKQFVDRKWVQYGQSYELLKCERCGSAFSWPMPDDNALARLYASDFDYRWYADHYSAKVRDCKIRLAEYRPWLGRRILDFGGGLGYFSKVAREAGFECETYDPFASKGALKKSSWDTVVALHVLEHSNNLSDTLGKIRQALVPGGRLILAVPNFASRGYRELQMNWVWAQPPLMHIYHFTAAGLSALLTSHMFSDVQVSYHERWDANLRSDLVLATRIHALDAEWGRRPFNALTIYRRLVARRNARERFRELEKAIEGHDSANSDCAELQIVCTSEAGAGL